MKKLVLALAMVFALVLTGCGSGGEEGGEASDNGGQEGIVLNGQTLEMEMNVTDDTINTLGEPVEVVEAPSCHYDGNDTIYTYEDFVLYAYQDGSENKLYIVELTSDAVETSEGAKVGMTEEEVISLMGDSFEKEGQTLNYALDDYKCIFTIGAEGTVDYIEYLPL